MPKSCKSYRLRLIIEYHRVLAWGKVVGIIEEEEGRSIASSLDADQVEVVAILSEIKQLLDGFQAINTRHSKELNPVASKEDEEEKRKQAEEVNVVQEVSELTLQYERTKKRREHIRGMNHVRTVLSSMGTIVAHPKRMIWVKIDESTFISLLSRLRELNNRLQELTGEYHRKALQDLQKKCYMEIVLTRTSVQELKYVMSASAFLNRQDSNLGVVSEERKESVDATLEELARLKTLNAPLEDLEMVQQSQGFQRQTGLIQYREEDAKHTWVSATYTTYTKEGTKQAVDVWIEWKKYEREYLKDDPSGDLKIHPNTLRRTAELAALLASPKPSEFGTPPCLGYFDDREKNSYRNRFGWIFNVPDEAQGDRFPTSLLSLYTDPRVGRPALDDRIQLAKSLAVSLLYLHTVNWLHKGLRSENVVFFDNIDGPNLGAPILCGFEYSRPNRVGTSERPDAKPEWDMYRWPDVQCEKTLEGNSRKTHDIYSLGLILIEIAHWRPLNDILELGEAAKIPIETTRLIRHRLLYITDIPGSLKQVKELMGRKYHDVVRLCLLGHDGFNLKADDNQMGPETGLRLQRAYWERVVQQLKAIGI